MRRGGDMVEVYSIDGIIPVVHPTAFVHPSAVLIGDVIVGPYVYVGPSASLRGDFGRLVIEEGASFQDCCVMHGFLETDTVIEKGVNVGHGAVLHGCVIKRNSLVGMNAVVLDEAVIGEESLVAVGAVVKAGMRVPPRSLVAGVPARIARKLNDQDISEQILGAELYRRLVQRSLHTMQRTDALAEMEPDRRRLTFDDVKAVRGGNQSQSEGSACSGTTMYRKR